MRAVLTGGPGSGKTTLIAHLRDLGFATVPEAALQIIDELTTEMGLAAQRVWRRAHVLEFQQRILQRQIDLELATDPGADKWVFLDRGRFDGLAYMRLARQEPTPEMLRLIREASYARVFSLDTLPGFQPRVETGRTTESLEDSLIIKATADQAYLQSGHAVIHVPVLSTPERAAHILTQLT